MKPSSLRDSKKGEGLFHQGLRPWLRAGQSSLRDSKNGGRGSFTRDFVPGYRQSSLRDEDGNTGGAFLN
jgi:hypothetical protein